MTSKRYLSNLTQNLFIDDNEPIYCKILVLGDFGVGKTSLIKSYVDGIFPKSYKVTVGVDFALKTIQWCNRKVHIQFWDVAGSERNCGFLTRVYYRYASAAIIVADISRPNTFETAIKWTIDLKEKLDLNVPKVLFVNKCDLSNFKTDKTYLDKFCKEFDLAGWYIVSAKTRENIEESVSFIISEILKTTNPDLQNSKDHVRPVLQLVNISSVKNEETQIYETTETFATIKHRLVSDKMNDSIQLKNENQEIDGKCC